MEGVTSLLSQKLSEGKKAKISPNISITGSVRLNWFRVWFNSAWLKLELPQSSYALTSLSRTMPNHCRFLPVVRTLSSRYGQLCIFCTGTLMGLVGASTSKSMHAMIYDLWVGIIRYEPYEITSPWK